MILGLSGTNASGKDELATYLRDSHNFLLFHTSDYIREEAMKRYGNALRPTLVKVGNELRQEGGAGILAQMGLKEYSARADKHKGVVISSIRTLGEVEVIHKAGGKIVFLDASRQIRYKRIQSRDRVDDRIDFDTFVEQEEVELFESNNPAKFNILGVKEESDILLKNETNVEDLTNEVAKQLNL